MAKVSFWQAIIRGNQSIDIGKTSVNIGRHPDRKTGCAIQMACRGAGIKMQYWAAAKRWPWLTRPFTSPCACHPDEKESGMEVIMHLFDFHVEPLKSAALRRLALKRLIEWARQAEAGTLPRPARATNGLKRARSQSA